LSWQKPARIAVALIGIVSAVAVYLAMGERRTAPPPEPIKKADDKAIVQLTQSIIERFAGSSKDFEILGIGYSFGYEDGTVKLTGNPLTIVVHKGDTRTVKISGREIKLSKDENYFELTGPVELLDSDGFWLKTDRATVNRADSIAHVPEAATFGKGRMTGSGVGFSYDETRQILLISQKARIKTVDEAGKAVMEMASETAMLDRLQHLTTLDTNVHVVRDMQIIGTDAANGRLSVNNDVVTYVELHGNSRVTGGTSIESMTARDISLDYTEDGKTLEAVKMAGGANVAMTGDAGKPGRKIAGETVDLTLAADGMLTSAMARENVRLELPAGADTPQRIITAQTLDGTGEPGKGLTSVTFNRDVSFIERPLASKTGAADNKAGRTARSQKLEALMANDAVTAATFTIDVTFEETGLKGCAARVEYQPQKESLALSGATKAGNPIVAEEDKAIEAELIEVPLETRLMKFRGNVRSSIKTSANQRCRPATERPATDRGANNVPRLLKSDAPMTINNAASLDFDSRKGYAEYSAAPGSRVMLAQEETSISGNTVVVDLTKGDLTATGNAISRLMLDKKDNRGTAHEIGYSDAKRLITYASAPKAGAGLGEVSLSSGPDSTIKAGTIELTLAAKENTLERMRAEKNVRLTEGQHTVEKGARLDYTAADENYVVKGDGVTPVVVVTRGANCRQESGQSIEFSKRTDSVKVTGNPHSGSTGPSKSACTSSTLK
jgi:lipopolysaccharide export system protein LptA